MSDLLQSLVSDLVAECADLGFRIGRLDEAAWYTPTPAEGWDIRDTVNHLRFFDRDALLAVTDPAGFAALLEELGEDVVHYVDRLTEQGRADSPTVVLGAWRTGQAALSPALRALEPGIRVPWFGPPMSPASFVTARLMETWAHGQDIADALDQERPASGRLRSVAELGVRARPFSYAAHGRAMPDRPVRVELTGPNGEPWTWGPDDAADVVRGTALDFCLLVTQRRHRDDLALSVSGPAAEEWMGIAQAFAGPPGPGRQPLGAS